MASLIKEKLHFGPFQVILGNTNAEKYCEIEIGICWMIKFCLFGDTKEKRFGIIKEGCQRIQNR